MNDDNRCKQCGQLVLYLGQFCSDDCCNLYHDLTYGFDYEPEDLDA